jgi:D-3-phosphoglycerate dehydrogenase
MPRLGRLRPKRFNVSKPPEALAGCDAIVVWHEMPVNRALLERLPNCQIVVRAGVGFDHIDLAAAAEMGIPGCCGLR